MKKATIALLLICTAAFAQEEGTFTDSRDKKKYKTVKIGEQTWMAENLNHDAKGSKCYGNKPANCKKYGKLYDWETAMEACPSGWHLPSVNEWKALDDFVGGEDVAWGKLKAKSGWNEDGNGTDEFGFSALPGGGGGGRGGGIGRIGFWWSANERNSLNAYARFIDNFDSEDSFWDEYEKSTLFSVRCVMN